MLNGRGTNRREFVERITAGALAIGVGSASFPETASAATAATKPDDSWLQGIKGNHAQIFDMPKADGGFSLFHVNNYLDTYKSAFNIVPPNVVAIVSLYGMSTPMGFNDAMWAKYPFGTATNTLLRGTKTAVTRNAYNTAPCWRCDDGTRGHRRHPRVGDDLRITESRCAFHSVQQRVQLLGWPACRRGRRKRA